MTREDYINKLETLLKKHLSKNEVEDILRDYNEYFEDGYRQSKTDLEIATKLGNPEIIAGQFIDEFKGNKSEGSSDNLGDIKEKAAKGFENIKNLSFVKQIGEKTATTFRQYEKKEEPIDDDKQKGFFSKVLSFVGRVFRGLMAIIKTLLKLAAMIITFMISVFVVVMFFGMTCALIFGSFAVFTAGLIFSDFTVFFMGIGIAGGVLMLALGILFIILAIVICKKAKKLLQAIKNKRTEKAINGGIQDV